MNILELNDLAIQFKSRAGTVRAVEGASFWLKKGEILGIAGESGCGKSTTALSIPKLLPANASMIRGEILFKGENLIRKSEKEMESLRWKEISVIFQGAMNALNPLKTVGQQIVEPILLHEKKTSTAEAKGRAEELLGQVGIAPNRFYSYPHEFSGGMRQRAMIAMSLACHPEMVIADEPVTALDVMIQAQIMELIRELSQQYRLSMIFVASGHEELYEIVSAAIEKHHGKKAVAVGENSWGDSQLFQDAGFPTLGLGAWGGNLHAPDEWVSLEEMETLICVLIDVIGQYCR